MLQSHKAASVRIKLHCAVTKLQGYVCARSAHRCALPSTISIAADILVHQRPSLPAARAPMVPTNIFMARDVRAYPEHTTIANYMRLFPLPALQAKHQLEGEWMYVIHTTSDAHAYAATALPTACACVVFLVSSCRQSSSWRRSGCTLMHMCKLQRNSHAHLHAHVSTSCHAGQASA
jgi:hypothetical protein